MRRVLDGLGGGVAREWVESVGEIDLEQSDVESRGDGVAGTSDDARSPLGQSVRLGGQGLRRADRA